MRIRKHANIAALLLSATSSSSSSSTNLHLQAHVCQLNQSPWDVSTTTFSPPSTPLPPPLAPPPFAQVKHGGGGGGGGGEYAVSEVKASVSPLKWEEEECERKWDSSSGLTAEEESEDAVVLCCKTDGKSWRCRREAVDGSAMCEHHLSLARNHSNSQSTTQSANKSAVVVVAETKEKRRPRPKMASSSNPYDFYYYSGFGPRWGKRRGNEHKEGNGMSTGNDEVVENAPSPSQSINREIDYIEDDDEDENEEEELYKRKRARKPIKARSLKSLTM